MGEHSMNELFRVRNLLALVGGLSVLSDVAVTDRTPASGIGQESCNLQAEPANGNRAGTAVDEAQDRFAWPSFEQDGATRITSATLSVRRGAFSDYAAAMQLRPRPRDVSPVADQDVGISSHVTLGHIADAFHIAYRPLRYAMPAGSHGGVGAGGSTALGVLEIETADGQRVKIGITPLGFSLNEKSADFESTFFSSYLAELVDDVYFVESGMHFPEEWKEQLSGLTDVLNGRRAYRRSYRR
jgi:hypothetical protein